MNNTKIKTIGMVVAMEKEVKPFLDNIGTLAMRLKHGDLKFTATTPKISRCF